MTVNGEVQTFEAHTRVHDLGLFVTLQLLDETPAVLSLGKLCENNGYSAEWVRGQKPRLTKGRQPLAELTTTSLLSFQDCQPTPEAEFIV